MGERFKTIQMLREGNIWLLKCLLSFFFIKKKKIPNQKGEKTPGRSCVIESEFGLIGI